ncbi:Na+/H+ antiporter subunit E [Parasulfitobacter algicola]|uniref:Na+/H+ antiporter subunit E n=1 Tax=Parasulfitobacter algicola TaxID=2614809 RepID=A0ABX2IL65_9RHOB|nr:Na+/H+ antiporter subunit E [Sulfitobacter algicola]NSX53310.1 Na+/H+ antiporter subunit E [Sulfitobacter algicola]
MNLLGLNTVLAFTWAFLTGSLTIASLAVGFAMGYVTLWLLQPLLGGPNPYFKKVYYWLRLLVMFHYELLVSSLAVVWDVITPTQLSQPGLVHMPLDVKTDAGIFLVTNLISLTPGTLSLDVSDDRKTLIVHAMFTDDPEEVCRTLKNGMERWVREAVEL